MRITIDYLEGKFSFNKDDLNGTGYWYCVRGSKNGPYGSTSPGRIVPLALAAELTAEAIRKGFSSSQVSRYTQKKKKVAKVIVKTKTKKSTPSLFGFNPFEKIDYNFASEIFKEETNEEPDMDCDQDSEVEYVDINS